MASTQERTCLESFLLSLAVVVVTWPFRISKGLSASPKIENITIDEPVRAGCCGFNVDMRWNISALPKNDIPSFKIWLTHENQQIRNTSVIEPNGNNSFEFTFLRLCPARKYTAHIASYDASMENITSNGNITFDVKPILDRMKTNNSADNGYVMVNWGLSKIVRSLGTQVVYKISICPEGRNKSPSICHNNTLEMCKATYNASSDSGHVELYEQNWLNYRGPDSNLNINQPLLKSWNSKERRFTCGIFLNACTTWRRGFRQTFQFDVEYGACSTPPQYERVSLQKDMDIARKIINCKTIDELVTLENLYVLNDYEQGLVFERKAEITSRLAECKGIENEHQGLSVGIDLTKRHNESKAARGQKRSHDEMNRKDQNHNEFGIDLKEPKEPSRKLLVAMAKKKGIIYAGNMNKKQLRRVISLNEQDPTILCLPEVEDSRNKYRENHREEACETSRRWRLKNPEKSAAHWARRKDLTEIGLFNWGVRKCDRVPGECWKTTPSKSANLTE